MHGDTSRRRQRHPLRNMCTGAVRLANDQEVVLAEPRTTEDLDLKPCARVVGIVNADKLHELFARTSDLVQRLQVARRELALEAAINRLDHFDVLILDDLAYVIKDQAETSALFELISTRYERRSMIITANQPFGEWGKVFQDPAMTLAAVDRLVHHSTIFEMNVESYRRRAAIARKQVGAGRPASYATPKNVGVPKPGDSASFTSPRHGSHPDCRAPRIQIDAPQSGAATTCAVRCWRRRWGATWPTCASGRQPLRSPPHVRTTPSGISKGSGSPCLLCSRSKAAHSSGASSTRR